jgi:hypothetical protein
MASASQVLRVPDGWIAAYNRGEFGAAVYWFSPDGIKKRKLSDHQINQFMCDGDRIFAVEGLAHLELSEGSMIEILKEKNSWKVIEFLPLPGAGQAIAQIGSGDYLVLTSEMLLRVNLEREMKILLASAGWNMLYPNSVSTDGKNVYIGMRQFVARCKLARSVQNFEFLIPDSKWINTKRE